MKKIAVITGASSGMGREFVLQIEKQEELLDEIWIIARRKDKLLQLKNQSVSGKLRILAIDLEEKESFERFRHILKKEQPRVCYLVNSCGVGYSKKIIETTETETSRMLNLNINALTTMTKLVLPYMKKGSIIYQLASSAAFAPQPGFAIYAATKAYVLNFSLALNQELKDEGIRVVAVCPGPVKTEFFATAYKNQKMKSYKKLVMADAKAVVKTALKDGKRKRKLSVYGIPMKAIRIICKYMPTQLIMNFMNKGM